MLFSEDTNKESAVIELLFSLNCQIHTRLCTKYKKKKKCSKSVMSVKVNGMKRSHFTLHFFIKMKEIKLLIMKMKLQTKQKKKVKK